MSETAQREPWQPMDFPGDRPRQCSQCHHDLTFAHGFCVVDETLWCYRCFAAPAAPEPSMDAAKPSEGEAPQSFGAAIRGARVAAGLSLRQAAAMLSTTAVALGEVERMTDRAVARADAAPEAPQGQPKGIIEVNLPYAMKDGPTYTGRPASSASQPGAHAELVERLRTYVQYFDSLRDENTADSEVWHRDMCAEAAGAIARLSAPAGPGSEGAEVERVRRMLGVATVRLEILQGRMRACAEEPQDHELSIFEIDGWLADQRAALEASGADHHDAGTGET